MRILLAEVEKDLNDIITQKLSSDGYSVDSCFNGEDAIGIDTSSGKILEYDKDRVD